MMKTMGLALGSLLLSVAVGGQKAEEEPRPWKFEERYQITMARTELLQSPERALRDLELQVLHADMALIWKERLEPDEMLEAVLGCLGDHQVEVKRSKPHYEWIKYADCFWEFTCVDHVTITIDPEDHPIELHIRSFTPR